MHRGCRACSVPAEWAYDRDSRVGQLARGLDEAPKRGWVIVDMKRDWRTIYPMPR